MIYPSHLQVQPFIYLFFLKKKNLLCSGCDKYNLLWVLRLSSSCTHTHFNQHIFGKCLFGCSCRKMTTGINVETKHLHGGGWADIRNIHSQTKYKQMQNGKHRNFHPRDLVLKIKSNCPPFHQVQRDFVVCFYEMFRAFYSPWIIYQCVVVQHNLLIPDLCAPHAQSVYTK